MQYVGRAIGSVSKTWNSINPSTLTGAIDVVVVEREDGELNCSPFHVRFGKFSLLRPTHRGVDFYVNGKNTGFQMKLGDGGEAFFVFETTEDVPEGLLTSPVQSPVSSPQTYASSDEEPDYLDINQGGNLDEAAVAAASEQARQEDDALSKATTQWIKEQDPDRIDDLISKLTRVNIPSTKNDRGEVIIDMTGYKPEGQDTKELEAVVQQILSHDLSHGRDHDEEHVNGECDCVPDLLPHGTEDLENKVDLKRPASIISTSSQASSTRSSPPGSPRSISSGASSKVKHYVKTLRLTSEMLQRLDLKAGKNTVQFKVRESKATVDACIFFWDSKTPVVISDIDGTITKSDAMGHLMNMIGRDWTHAGVGKLFTDIHNNGYNIMYLTARAVGQAQTTRSYLRSVQQDGYELPEGPVILSPDRTIAALHREVIMRKPEIFKMACLRDIAKLYGYVEGTPFYAGFGNRITDALSYRSVGIPSTKIFTIDTNSEVRMELLELTGYKSSYVLITDLVDHFFPPYNPTQRTLRSAETIDFTDANFWKAPVVPLSDEDTLSEDEDSVKDFSPDRPRPVFGTDSEAEEGESSSDFDDDYDDEDEDDDEESSGESSEDEPRSPVPTPKSAT